MILLNNNTLTVHYGGNVYSKEVNATEIAMVKVHALDSNYQEIIDLCFPTPAKLLLKEGFWEQGGSIYYKNINVSIPKVLADKLMTADESEFNRLIRFWSWLSLNPNPRTRENLYGWVEKNGIQLTEGGLMILYRRVNKLKLENTALGRFVKKTYERLRKQKKSTNILVQQDDEDGMYCISNTVFHNHIIIGNLKELYYLPNLEPIFTDAHTGKERYKIGVESFMKREEGDESSAECSRGYHAGSQDFSFSGFGDTPIVIVVNPMYVLNSVENHYKMRFTRFTPVAVLNEDAEWINDPLVHERIDECYDAAVERLEDLLNEATFEDFKKHEVLGNQWNLAVGFETVLKILN